MKVWVVVEWWDCEGNADPLGVFTTRELAEKAKAEHAPKSTSKTSGIDIIEYELDKVRELVP